MSILTQSESSTNERAALIQAAFRIEYLTIAWMVIEACGRNQFGDRGEQPDPPSFWH
jgi:hypothetical protein